VGVGPKGRQEVPSTLSRERTSDVADQRLGSRGHAEGSQFLGAGNSAAFAFGSTNSSGSVFNFNPQISCEDQGTAQRSKFQA